MKFGDVFDWTVTKSTVVRLMYVGGGSALVLHDPQSGSPDGWDFGQVVGDAKRADPTWPDAGAYDIEVVDQVADGPAV